MGLFSKKRDSSEEGLAQLPEGRWISRITNTRSIAPGQMLAFDPFSGCSKLIDDDTASFLLAFSTLRSSDEHAGHIHTISGGHTDGRACFKQIFEQDLLISEEQIFSGKWASEDTAEITTLSWATKNRPELLKRGMESWVKSLDRFGKQLRLLVCDSSDRDVAEANRRTLEQIAATSSLTASYAGPEEKRRFAAGLIKEGIDPQLVEFSLFNPFNRSFNLGANRNAQLLATQGECFISTDDDCLCAFTASALEKEDLQVFPPHVNPIETQYFPSRAEAWSLPTEELDPVELFGRNLGQTYASVMAGLGKETHMEVTSSAHAWQLAQNPGRVLFTQCGPWGHPARNHHDNLLQLDDRFREQISDAEDYAMAAGSDGVMACAPTWSLGFQSFFMIMTAGLDNRHSLPPFIPALRGEDQIWNAMIQYSLPGTVYSFAPYAMRHDPESGRLPQRDGICNPMVTYARCIGLCIYEYIRTSESLPLLGTPQERLQKLGRHLSELGTMDWNALKHYLSEMLFNHLGSQLHYLTDLLSTYNRHPMNWANDVERYLDNALTILEGKTTFVPFDLTDLETNDVSAFFKSHLQSTGLLLQSWNDILSATANLEKKEISVGVNIGKNNR